MNLHGSYIILLIALWVKKMQIIVHFLMALNTHEIIDNIFSDYEKKADLIMETIDKIIFGDNQFFGINHMSQEKAQQLAEQFFDISNIYKVYDIAIEPV